MPKLSSRPTQRNSSSTPVFIIDAVICTYLRLSCIAGCHSRRTSDQRVTAAGSANEIISHGLPACTVPMQRAETIAQWGGARDARSNAQLSMGKEAGKISCTVSKDSCPPPIVPGCVSQTLRSKSMIWPASMRSSAARALSRAGWCLPFACAFTQALEYLTESTIHIFTLGISAGACNWLQIFHA